MNSIDLPQTTNRQLFLNSAKTIKLIDHCNILFIEADDNYSKVHLNDQTEILLSKTLRIVEAELNDNLFFRCHRTYLVNVLFIKEIFKGDEMFILLKNNHKVPLAKRRLSDLRKLFAVYQ